MSFSVISTSLPPSLPLSFHYFPTSLSSIPTFTPFSFLSRPALYLSPFTSLHFPWHPPLKPSSVMPLNTGSSSSVFKASLRPLPSLEHRKMAHKRAPPPAFSSAPMNEHQRLTEDRIAEPPSLDIFISRTIRVGGDKGVYLASRPPS